MPLIDVTHDGKVGEEVLRRLGELERLGARPWPPQLPASCGRQASGA